MPANSPHLRTSVGGDYRGDLRQWAGKLMTNVPVCNPECAGTAISAAWCSFDYAYYNVEGEGCSIRGETAERIAMSPAYRLKLLLLKLSERDE